MGRNSLSEHLSAPKSATRCQGVPEGAVGASLRAKDSQPEQLNSMLTTPLFQQPYVLTSRINMIRCFDQFEQSILTSIVSVELQAEPLEFI